MEDKKLRSEVEALAGQIEGMRVIVTAICLTHPDRNTLRAIAEELLKSQRELLLAQPLSEDFLAGLDVAGNAMLRLIQPSQS
jgi:hypothetical protein